MGLKALALGAGVMVAAVVSALPTHAGDNNGNFMVRVLATGVLPDTDAGAISVNGVPTLPPGSLDVPNEIIPALTLSYFFNKNVALELFCCFAKLDVDGKGALAGTDVASTWIFPPVLTLQYHFDPVAGLKPYVGAGVQYIAFFDTKSNDLGGSMDLDNAWGFTLQAGVDIELGQGWYLNADVKKTWLDTEWQINTGGNVLSGKVDVDPLIVSAGLGYRFNLEDLFGARMSSVPLK